MDTYIAYFDESGDDGTISYSSEYFILTSVYMNAAGWQKNFEDMYACRKRLKDRFGLHIAEELHTKQLLTDKEPYKKYKWGPESRKAVLKEIAGTVAELDVKAVNVVIDKTRITEPGYPVLEKALTRTIRCLENDSCGRWNYIIISDEGRIAPMRKIGRKIRSYGPAPATDTEGYHERPVNNLMEDILEKNSEESYFIQICDFISYIVRLYYKVCCKHEALPKRVGRVIDDAFVTGILDVLRAGEVLDLKANEANEYGIVICPE